MTCPSCRELEDITDLSTPYVVRTCQKCSREIKLRTPGAHGIGFVVNKGDRVVMPKDFLAISANPLKGRGQLTPHGLSWFAKLVFGVGIANRESRNNFSKSLNSLIEDSEKPFKDANIFKGVDIKNVDSSEIKKKLEGQ